jgi:hypothetical protein
MCALYENNAEMMMEVNVMHNERVIVSFSSESHDDSEIISHLS